MARFRRRQSLRVIVFYPRQGRRDGGKEQDQLENQNRPPEQSIVTPLPAILHRRELLVRPHLLREWVEKAVEFPKTHEIERLLEFVCSANPQAADALAPAKWLGPFAVDIRYPGDAAESPTEEIRPSVRVA